jgi:SsrA-binding protein
MTQAKEITNRKAKFQYHLMQSFEAGIVLQGTEVKSLRHGDANLNDAYCVFREGELFVRSMFIGEYKHGNINNHDTRRERKLLLKRSELNKLERRVTEKGLTIVPYRIFFSERGQAKLEIFLAQGKKAYDKRESIKQKDIKRDIERMRKL